MSVQQRLWHERDEVSPLLRAGAQVRLCREARLFAPAVREPLVRILHEAALTALEQLLAEGRYAADVCT